MGDSQTAPYTTDPTIPGVLQVAGEYNWVDQLRALRPNGVTITSAAIIGETSTQLVTDQLPAVADLAAHGAIQYAVLETGGADAIFQFTKDILHDKPSEFIHTVLTNIETVVDTVTHAGNVHMVIVDVPNFTVTPYFRENVTTNHTQTKRMSDAIEALNEQIVEFAAPRGIPVVDLDGLYQLTQHPLTLGGAQVTGQFTPDGLHLRTALQGVFANAILEALHVAYGEHVANLQLTDEEILDRAGIDHGPGRTFFDVRPFVIACDGSSSPFATSTNPRIELGRDLHWSDRVYLVPSKGNRLDRDRLGLAVVEHATNVVVEFDDGLGQRVFAVNA
jgi:lysophospholipase L1-like esterase